MKCLHSRGKSKAVIPEVPASSGVQFTNVGETVDEEATLSPSKSLPVSKFRTKRNYFEGEGHSLKATKSEPHGRPDRPDSGGKRAIREVLLRSRSPALHKRTKRSTSREAGTSCVRDSLFV